MKSTPQVQNIVTPTPVDVSNGEISVEAGSFYYKPNLIRVKKGEKIKLTLVSVSVMHDFNIDELGVKMPIVKSGSTGTVEFTPDKVGEFEFYCSVGQHRQYGQVGKLIVIE
jgi:cytochrome c oxidase subunit 2